MLTISINWVGGLQALGASMLMSLVCYFLADFLLERFDRSNGNETGMIAGFVALAGLVIANVVSVSGGLFFGFSTALILVVGVILFLSVCLSVLIINRRL